MCMCVCIINISIDIKIKILAASHGQILQQNRNYDGHLGKARCKICLEKPDEALNIFLNALDEKNVQNKFHDYTRDACKLPPGPDKEIIVGRTPT